MQAIGLQPSAVAGRPTEAGDRRGSGTARSHRAPGSGSHSVHGSRSGTVHSAAHRISEPVRAQRPTRGAGRMPGCVVSFCFDVEMRSPRFAGGLVSLSIALCLLLHCCFFLTLRVSLFCLACALYGEEFVLRSQILYAVMPACSFQCRRLDLSHYCNYYYYAL